MSGRLSRRRFITIVAASVPASATAWAKPAAPKPVRWTGIAMGAQAQIILSHEDAALARDALAAAVTEIARLEQVFSVYEPRSEVSRLNRDGSLEAPSGDLVRLLSEAREISDATGGAFDVTVQSLFKAYQAGGKTDAELAAARALVDYRKLSISPARLAFADPGMAVTLNGIAQGYITDRVSDLLRRRAFDRSLIDLGEIRANEAAFGETGWPVAIADPKDADRVLARLSLRNRAMATSAPAGYLFGSELALHHLLDPASGSSAGHYRSLSVLASNATVADGLSTGLSVLPPASLPAVLSKFSGIEVLAKPSSGPLFRL